MSSEEENSPRQTTQTSKVAVSQIDDQKYNEEPVIPHQDDDEYAASSSK